MASKNVQGYQGVNAASGFTPDVVVDLRSDTVTLPSKGMREAIANAALGDDIFGEDPTTNGKKFYCLISLVKHSFLWSSFNFAFYRQNLRNV